MKSRRTFLRGLAAGMVALGVLVVPVLADELFGVLTKVDVAGKKVTVEEKGTDKEVVVTVTSDTEYETPKQTSKLDLEKLSKNVERAKEKGRKGIRVTVTHKDGTASRIKVEAKKKDAP